MQSIKDLGQMRAVIVGLSPDSAKSHTNFISMHNLKLNLLSDPEREVLNNYGVWQLKKIYGRQHYGVVRATFPTDPGRRIAHMWPKVQVKGPR